MDTATIRGFFSVLPKQTPELGLAACTDRLSSREPQSKNGANGEEAADALGEAADKGTDDALKAEGLHDSFAAVVFPGYPVTPRVWIAYQGPEKSGYLDGSDEAVATAGDVAPILLKKASP